jgi:hypothetical protein
MKRRIAQLIAALAVSLLLAACSAEIGDSCTTNVDCDPLGGRICDTSQLEGYCTIEGCEIGSCPEEAVCVRFFPSSFLSVPCDPLTEDAVLGTTAKGTRTNDCTSTEICLSGGYCVLRNQETRFCMLACEANDDCRGGFECRTTGTQGAEAVPDPDNPGIRQSRFCAQQI